jgi:hypothetical protein
MGPDHVIRITGQRADNYRPEFRLGKSGAGVCVAGMDQTEGPKTRNKLTRYHPTMSNRSKNAV